MAVTLDSTRAAIAEGLKPKSGGPFLDEWDFLCRAVYTKDEASGQILPFPQWPYLEYLTRQRRQFFHEPPCHAWEKSRRMLITHWLTSLYLYDTLTQPNHANFVGSRKLETSAYLLGEERILGVYNRIPADVWPDKPELERGAKRGLGVESLHCKQTGSYIQAIASGADQLRQFTATAVLCDEVAFWERWRESWAAMRPTIEGGGHIDIVTTPNLGAQAEEIYHPRGS